MMRFLKTEADNPGGAVALDGYSVDITEVADGVVGRFSLADIARVSIGVENNSDLSTAAITLQVSLDGRSWENIGTAVTASNTAEPFIDVSGWPWGSLGVTTAHGSADSGAPVSVWGIPYEDLR